ncbi:hypothetical protein Esi_0410_0004 [Ectocarpus siliculosus]|uniref:Uncharacterized protein n=1 Tax=Ectocarpus siliculosus TaxID=2880 RepID=D7G0K5_ECTSI|nr:hypothetical protein Esi_0410_0004 [Ectocarpus siliculosus]|eukprot:CBJ33034.1 hypothetical protein Esi_0410_0004 [Ectocarpus siliculosus]
MARRRLHTGATEARRLRLELGSSHR